MVAVRARQKQTELECAVASEQAAIKDQLLIASPVACNQSNNQCYICRNNENHEDFMPAVHKKSPVFGLT
jgi:hypothetical protein